ISHALACEGDQLDDLKTTAETYLVVESSLVYHRGLLSWLKDRPLTPSNLQVSEYSLYRLTSTPLKEFISAFRESKPQNTTHISAPPELFCQVVRNHEQARQAWPALLKSLVKPTGGVLDRHFMRPISLRITRVLANTSLTPNQVSIFSTLLAFLASWMLIWPGDQWPLVAGLLFIVMRIIDCIDGELARLKYAGSSFGAWIDTVGDGLGIVTWVTGTSLLAAKTSSFAISLGVFGNVGWFGVQVLQYLAVLQGGGRGSFQAVEWGHRAPSKNALERLVALVEPLLRIDFISCAYVALVVVKAYEPLLWAHAIISWVSAVYFLSQLLRKRSTVTAREQMPIAAVGEPEKTAESSKSP
ncbi:MAG: CDP-alcohol phosphatidyltransferase family protein, partial [Polyangiaceae bacterium]|nr:CDP-alcohol phosphatidyltransferase family protein [Polyangiaceae bacterium]